MQNSILNILNITFIINLLLFTHSKNRSFPFNNPPGEKYNYLKDTEDVQQDHTITCGQQ